MIGREITRAIKLILPANGRYKLSLNRHRLTDMLPDVVYFEVALKDGVVMLRPLKVYDTSLEKIRSKVRKLGLHENTVKEAIEWARSK